MSVDPRFSFKQAAGYKNRRHATYHHQLCYLLTLTALGLCSVTNVIFSFYTWLSILSRIRTKILKFADDTTLQLITNSDESEYRDQVNKLISWCNDNKLEFNVNKTKEMIVDFRRKKSSPPSPLVIDDRTVEIV